MDYLRQFHQQFRNRLVVLLLLPSVVLIATWWLCSQVFHLQAAFTFVMLVVVATLSVTLLAWQASRYLSAPIDLVWQAILHLVPDNHGTPAPQLASAPYGRDLVKHLSDNIYQLAINGARAMDSYGQAEQDLHHNSVAMKLPLPMIVLDAKTTITFANAAAIQYLAIPENELVGKNFYNLLDLYFPSSDTLDHWLKTVQAKAVTATDSWQRVRLQLPSHRTLQFDLAASYSKDEPQGHEVLLLFFDRTASYEQDDQSLSFIALAVHELRTPIALLLGYIELFQQELGDILDPELKRFMYQMQTTGQKLSTFVANVLTVANIESNNLELQLAKVDWPSLLSQAIADLRLRAEVRDLKLELNIAPGLPPAGANAPTINEVVVNLVENAIKYSRKATDRRIIVTSGLNQEGLIETTVQDFGLGIATSVLPNLFEKFYRNHRTKQQLSGSGLGLYLCRLIIEAHGGNIWVRSREGQGSSFSFTVLPYSKLASELKTGDNNDIVHSAHGWVKNHSLYRR